MMYTYTTGIHLWKKKMTIGKRKYMLTRGGRICRLRRAVVTAAGSGFSVVLSSCGFSRISGAKRRSVPTSHARDNYSHASSNARARLIRRVLIRTNALAVVSKRRGVNRMYKINWLFENYMLAY